MDYFYCWRIFPNFSHYFIINKKEAVGKLKHFVFLFNYWLQFLMHIWAAPSSENSNQFLKVLNNLKEFLGYKI